MSRKPPTPTADPIDDSEHMVDLDAIYLRADHNLALLQFLADAQVFNSERGTDDEDIAEHAWYAMKDLVGDVRVALKRLNDEVYAERKARRQAQAQS